MNQERRRRLDQHFRAAYIAGAEAAWRALLGRPMTTGDLKTVLKRYRGER